MVASHTAVPKGTAVWLATFVRCLTASVLAIGFPLSDASGIISLRIRLNGFFSNKHHVLSPKNRGSWSRKSTSVEKTAIFDVFRKVLIDKWLRRYLSVNGRFTKSEFAKGKVSLRERPCFAV